MVAAHIQAQASLRDGARVPASTFKSSLRRWQAEYKARQASPAAAAERLANEFLLGKPATRSRR